MLIKNKLWFFNKDYREVIAKIPDNSIDLIATDPPYRVTNRGNSGTMGGMMKDKKTMKGKIFDFNDLNISDYINEFYRILKPNAHCYIFCNQKNLFQFMEVINRHSKFKWFKNLIWLKDNKIANQYYMSQFEYIIFLRKGKAKRINHCGTSEVLRFKNEKTKDAQGKTIHPTEKPINLMKTLIKNSTKENEIVCDPFSGIGSTALACLESNRKFIGTEIDKDFYEVAKNRLLQRGD